MLRKEQDEKIAQLESGFARIAAREWQINRPKLWKELRWKLELYDALKEAGDQADAYMEKVQSNPGNDPATDYLPAKEVALRTWILLPDVDDG